MIIVRTPFRVSFAGGGTDLSYFYRKHGGVVLSTSLSKYSYLSMHSAFEEKGYLIKYSKMEDELNLENLKHPIVREVFGMYKINGVDFACASDIPAGTGLGSSSAFTCGIIKLCQAFKGIKNSQLEIAGIACDVEINRLKEPIGKQDQYGCALPGLKKIEFFKNGKVEVTPLILDKRNKERLEDSLILVYCGGSRSASEILNKQKKNTLKSNELTNNLLSMSEQCHKLSESLLSDPDCLGDYLNDAWERKKTFSEDISNNEIDSIYKRALDAGAKGGKLLGAGGAGFLLIHSPGNIDTIKDAFKEFITIDFKFDFTGTKVIYNDQLHSN